MIAEYASEERAQPVTPDRPERAIQIRAFLTIGHISSRLTRQFHLDLPEGSYLVSNCISGLSAEGVIPVFAEPVVSMTRRAEQWQRIVAAGANQRICHVFEDEEGFEEWQRGIGAVCQ